MKVRKVTYPTPLSEVSDISNDNIDVFVELEDGTNYCFVVSTPLNLCKFMDDNDIGFIPASQPDIIVKELTEENILLALENYAEDDAFWMKLLYVAGTNRDYIDIEKINKAINDIQKFNDELTNISE